MITHNESNITLGQLATDRPAAISLFERLGLDYCCGGRRTLADACAAAGIDADTVLDAIRAEESRHEPAPTQVWTELSMTQLADHIETTHHVFTRDVLARLSHIVPRVVAAHSETHPELGELAQTIQTLTEEMHDHMIREDRVVFPWIRRLERPSEIQGGPPWSIKRPISCMIHDHDDAGAALAKIRALAHDFAVPPGACATYRSMLTLLEDLERDMHAHVHKENNILFPAGIAAEERIANTHASARPRSDTTT